MISGWRRLVQTVSAGAAASGIVLKVPVIVPGVSGGCAGVIGTGLTLYLLPTALAGLTSPGHLVFVAAVAWLLPAVLVGRAVCGWICPLGFLQDLLAGLGRRLGITVNPPPGDLRLRYTKYVVLLLTLVGAAALIRPWYAVCPMHYLASQLENPRLGYYATLRLGLVSLPVLASMIVPRFLCRYVCPVGVLLRIAHGWTALDRLASVRALKPGCLGCPRCTTCPMGLTPAEDFPSGSDCIRCGRCFECRRAGR